MCLCLYTITTTRRGITHRLLARRIARKILIPKTKTPKFQIRYLLFFLNKSKAGRLSPDFIFTTTNKTKQNYNELPN